MFFLYFSGESSKTSSISELFTLPIVEWYEAWYLYGLVGLKFYCSAIHPLTVLSLKLPFLPLMLTSVYCAVGVVWGWILFYSQTLRRKSSVVSTFQMTGTARRTSKKNQWISGSNYLLLWFSWLPRDHGTNSSSPLFLNKNSKTSFFVNLWTLLDQEAMEITGEISFFILSQCSIYVLFTSPNKSNDLQRIQAGMAY